MSLHLAHHALIIQQPGRQVNVVELLSDIKRLTFVPAFDVATLESMFPGRREIKKLEKIQQSSNRHPTPLRKSYEEVS
ncbi:hypothetical protein K443DRAFT_675040 [Laccaria amethystina LaAM-08-1]|uniref:Uncharacterized protein n=1 Tax=Laccaria amethystina LaAM-08-1 TaxID=1095629 RepID=A0A0C9YBN7_9AGAR|nr:hypothetical protein K443DRAFT_675040 [Laccaria amethystina LaAM-08-1]